MPTLDTAWTRRSNPAKAIPIAKHWLLRNAVGFRGRVRRRHCRSFLGGSGLLFPGHGRSLVHVATTWQGSVRRRLPLRLGVCSVGLGGRHAVSSLVTRGDRTTRQCSVGSTKPDPVLSTLLLRQNTEKLEPAQQQPKSLKVNGRGDRIRTCDPHTPSVMRYQAALRPDRASPQGQASRALVASLRDGKRPGALACLCRRVRDRRAPSFGDAAVSAPPGE